MFTETEKAIVIKALQNLIYDIEDDIENMEDFLSEQKISEKRSRLDVARSALEKLASE